MGGRRLEMNWTVGGCDTLALWAYPVPQNTWCQTYGLTLLGFRVLLHGLF